MKSCLVSDFAGNWFIIPVERREDFRRWITWKLCTRKDQKPESWMTEVPHGPESITFEFRP
jgi:hypothetical protein